MSPAIATAKTEQMTVQDVIVLLQVGYKEEDVLKEIQKRGMTGKFSLSPGQVLQLRKAGASMRLIRSMGIAGAKAKAPKPVTFEELKTWLQQKKSEDWITKELKRRGVVAEQFPMSAVLALRKQGMSVQLLRLVVQLKSKAKPADRPTPREPGADVPPERRPSEPMPRVPFPIDPRVPQPATRPVARRAQEPSGQPMIPVKTTRWGVRPAKAQPLTEHEKQVYRRTAERLPRPSDGVFKYLSGFYHIKVPAKWHILKDIHPTTGEVTLFLTPEDTLKVSQLQRAVWVTLEHIPQGDRSAQTRSLKQTARFLIQRYLMKESGVTEKQRLKMVTFQGNQVVSVALEGKARLDAHKLRKQFYLMQKEDYYLLMGMQAPPASFDEFAKTAKAVLDSMKLARADQDLPGTRSDQAVAAQKIIQQNMSGVVSIMCLSRVNGKLKPVSSGSGFVVTSDGYVLTNHHVAVNSRTGKPYDMYYLNWDATTGRKFAKAKFVAAHMKQAQRGQVRMVDAKTGRISVRFQRQHVDVALLKIVDAGTYPTVKLSSVKRAMLGDQVIAMGFPSEGASIDTMGNESITTTIGVISRLVRLADKRVNEIQHSAKVAGGNSGGPLFDVHTGAVIGINTWVGTFDKRLPRPGMGLGYYYAIPIDLAWQYFPDFIDTDSKSYKAHEWYTWGMKWLANRQWAPAKRAFLRAVRMNPNMAVAHMQLARLYLERATQRQDDQRHEWLKLSRRWADQGLRQELNHPNLMSLLARVAIERKDWSTASYLLQQLVEKHPFDWEVFALRSVMYNLQGEYQKALQDARQVIRLAGKLLPSGHMLRGMILYRAKRYFEGQQAYRMALRVDPTNLQAQVNEALGYTYLKQYDDALSRLRQLARQRKFEPTVFEGMMYTYAAKRDFVQSWKAFNAMWRSSMLRGQTVSAFSLYMGGLLAQRVLSPKIRERLKWGLWGTVVGSYNLDPTAQRVGVFLALAAAQKGYRGLAYGLSQRIRTPIEDKEVKKLYDKISGKLPRQGISQQAWLYITTQAHPRWSPALVWDLFRDTPSLLELRTAKLIAKQGYSVPLLVKMLQVSQQRRKQGIKGGQSGQGTQGTQGTQGSRAFQRHRALIIRTVLEVFRSLRESNVNLWLSLQHPDVDRSQRAQLFWNMVTQIRNGTMSMRSYQPYQVKIQRHPQYGLLGQYFFRLRVGNQYFKRYWRLRYYNGRWLLF